MLNNPFRVSWKKKKKKKCWDHLLYSDVIRFFVAKQGNVRKSKKLMKIVNTDGENIHIFITTYLMSMKFSGKMYLMIILKVIKNLSLTLFLEVIFCGKTDSFLEPATLIKNEIFLKYFSRILFNVLEDFFYRTPSLYF